MLLIPCPWCGERDEVEFRYGGETGKSRPSQDLQTDEASWADYLFMKTNRAGVIRESWFHAFGCRQWFGIQRDTRTNVILVARAEEVAQPVTVSAIVGEAGQ